MQKSIDCLEDNRLSRKIMVAPWSVKTGGPVEISFLWITKIGSFAESRGSKADSTKKSLCSYSLKSSPWPFII